MPIATAAGSLWAFHCTIDGMVAEHVDRRPGLARPPATATDRAYPHCSGKSCSSSMPELVGRVVERTRGDVAVDAQHVEPGVDRQLDVAPHLGRGGVGERHRASAAGWRP